MATPPKHFITVEDYIEQERTALDRHEYFNGEIFAIAGGTIPHSTISTNLLIEIGSQLRETDCTARNRDTRIRTSPAGLYSYADAVVSCADEQIDKDTLLNPVVIVEVLSESTKDYERGTKFEQYRQIPSFREYLILAQDRPYLEHHVRESVHGRLWTMREHTNFEKVITLESIPVKLRLADIYAKVSFPPGPGQETDTASLRG